MWYNFKRWNKKRKCPMRVFVVVCFKNVKQKRNSTMRLFGVVHYEQVEQKRRMQNEKNSCGSFSMGRTRKEPIE